MYCRLSMCFSTITFIAITRNDPPFPPFPSIHTLSSSAHILVSISQSKQNVLKHSCCRTNQYLGVGNPTDNLYGFSPCFLYCCPSAIGSGPYFVSEFRIHCFQSILKIECLGTLYKCCTSCAFKASSQIDGCLLALQVTLQLDGPQAMKILNRALQKWPKPSCQRQLFAARRRTCSRCSIPC